jgi:uncharacterized protein YecE (DUF72 family)
MAKAFIGTSGWLYKGWSARFYPKGMNAKDRLTHYATYFDTVEINTTFYHLPKVPAVRSWRTRTPDHFVFTTKASRYLTHIRRLNIERKNVDLYMNRIRPLRQKLGPILFQLPPRWNPNPDRLRKAISLLPKRKRYTFEFRDPRWFTPETLNLLRANHIAFCIYHLAGFLSPLEVTSDFVYIRLHGPKGKYAGKYSKTELKVWAKHISGWLRNNLDVFCYFDNDEKSFAVQNALELKKMLRHNAYTKKSI